jgi:hypothetical protein
MAQYLHIPTAVLIAAFMCSVATMPAATLAADEPPPAHDKIDKDDHHEGHHEARDLILGPHVEGHIAFLHAELDITPAQEKLWTPVAEAMRQDVKAMEEARSHIAGTDGDENAIQHLQNRAMFARLRADGEERFLKAFTPLYNQLSDTQKAVADDLLCEKME